VKEVCVNCVKLRLTACNTISGIGKDIQCGGEAIEKSTK